ncbi:MAG: hypothetical protein JSV50_04425, partial [Desulfobacteraceae bacterium]
MPKQIIFDIKNLFVSLPMGPYMIRFTWLNEGPVLNQAPAGTSGLSLLFSLLLSIDLIISSWPIEDKGLTVLREIHQRVKLFLGATGING